jgi:sec-independent protein translocase protein TatA
MLLALGTIGGSELIIVLVVVLVLFGGSQLPKLARSIGEAQKEFKSGLNEEDQRKDERKPST